MENDGPNKQEIKSGKTKNSWINYNPTKDLSNFVAYVKLLKKEPFLLSLPYLVLFHQYMM